MSHLPIFRDVNQMIDWTLANCQGPAVVSYCGSCVIFYRDQLGLPEWKFGTEVPPPHCPSCGSDETEYTEPDKLRCGMCEWEWRVL